MRYRGGVRIIHRVAIAAAIVLTVASGASGAATNPVHILFIGDSLTYGSVTSNIANAYPARVTRSVHGQASILGKGGVVTSYWKPAALPTGIGVAVVELGTNDVYNHVAVAKFDRDYRHLLAAIHVKSPGVKFVCLSVWWPPGGFGAVPPYDERIQADCPGEYVDIAQFAHPPNLAARDHFHPNDAGHKLIASVIIPAVRATLAHG